MTSTNILIPLMLSSFLQSVALSCSSLYRYIVVVHPGMEQLRRTFFAGDRFGLLGGFDFRDCDCLGTLSLNFLQSG